MIGLIKGTMRNVKSVPGLPAPIASFNTNVGGYPLEVVSSVEAVQSGSGTPSPDNVRPITGWSGANVTRAGKNLLDDSKDRFAFVSTMQEALINFRQYNKYATGYCNVTNGVMSNNATYTTYFVPCKPNTTYSLKCYTASAFTSVHTLDSNGNTLSKSSNWVISYTVTTENNASFLAFAYAGEGGATVEESSTPSAEYIPYNGNTYTIPFGDSYYGGELYVAKGVLMLRVTKALANLGDYSWTYDSANQRFYTSTALSGADSNKPFLCDIYKYVGSFTQLVDKSCANIYNTRVGIKDLDYTDPTVFKNAMSGHTLLYELAAPFTIQLTPQQIAQLPGDNNVFADCGNIDSVKYLNRQIYYGR